MWAIDQAASFETADRYLLRPVFWQQSVSVPYHRREGALADQIKPTRVTRYLPPLRQPEPPRRPSPPRLCAPGSQLQRLEYQPEGSNT